jgi:Na+-translocating ferredoxin:NAD+ oxidoreductase RNF subunit RnfB
MAEPELEDIGDYNTLKGEKKTIVWSVIIVGLLIGIAYSIAYKVYSNTDSIKVKDVITIVPQSKCIPVR